MTNLVWRIMPPEEVGELEACQALEPKRRARQMQCVCGRFVKRSTFWRRGYDVNGMSSWGWHCSQCGDMVERS